MFSQTGKKNPAPIANRIPGILAVLVSLSSIKSIVTNFRITADPKTETLRHQFGDSSNCRKFPRNNYKNG
jgi:hypothetical protein